MTNNNAMCDFESLSCYSLGAVFASSEGERTEVLRGDIERLSEVLASEIQSVGGIILDLSRSALAGTCRCFLSDEMIASR